MEEYLSMNPFSLSDAGDYMRRYLSQVNERLADIYREVPELPNLRANPALDVRDLIPQWQTIELTNPLFDFSLPIFPNTTARVATFATEEDGTLLRLIVMGQEEVVTSYSNSLKVTRIQAVREWGLPSYGGSIGGMSPPLHSIQPHDLIIDASTPSLDPDVPIDEGYRLLIELEATLGGTQGPQDDDPRGVHHGILSDSLIPDAVRANTCDVWLMHAPTKPEITASTIPPGMVRVHGPRQSASGKPFELHIEGVRDTRYKLHVDVEITAVPGASVMGHFHSE